MTVDEEQIRDLIERWARAVHAGDLDGVLADHADDIVMFDVPGHAVSVAQDLAAAGVRVSAFGPHRLRATTHLDVSAEDIERALSVCAAVLAG